jgi:hypothetical protein
MDSEMSAAYAMSVKAFAMSMKTSRMSGSTAVHVARARMKASGMGGTNALWVTRKPVASCMSRPMDSAMSAG